MLLHDKFIKLKPNYSWNYVIKDYYNLSIEAYFLLIHNKFDEDLLAYDEFIKLYPDNINY